MNLIYYLLICLIEIYYVKGCRYQCPGANKGTCESYCKSQKKQCLFCTNYKMAFQAMDDCYCTCVCQKWTYNSCML